METQSQQTPPLTQPVARESTASLAFVFVVVLIDAIGFGIIMPVMPQLIIELTGASLADAARDAGWLAFAYAAMQFLSGPVMGSLGDRFGRRPVLLLSLAAFGVNYLLTGLAPGLGWLFLGRVIAGITGASFSTAYAYVADVTPPEKRAQNFGLIGVGFGLGFIIGPTLGGFMGEYGTRAPFFVAAGLAGVNLIYGLVFMRESLAPGLRRPFVFWRANPIGVLGALAKQHASVARFAWAIFLLQLSNQVFSVWSFFAIGRFAWSSRMIGVTLAAYGIVAGVVQGWLIRILIPRIGERRAVVIGLWATAASMFVYAFSPYGWVVFLGILVSAPGDLAYPSLNALMSQRADATAQGELQGAVASLTSLTTIIGPLMLTQTFALFTGDAPLFGVHFSGAPFIVGAALALGALVLFERTVRRWPGK
jgi:DHA1 family tetracycline resistance protein-like MFS transporter